MQRIEQELVAPIIEMLVDEALFEILVDRFPINRGLLIEDYLPRESVA